MLGCWQQCNPSTKQSSLTREEAATLKFPAFEHDFIEKNKGDKGKQ